MRKKPWKQFALPLLLWGCASDTVGQVDGTLTFENKPLANAQVYFIPSAGPASAGWTKEDGTFEVFTRSPGDGLSPGEYRVAVMPADPLKDPLPISKKYHAVETSGLTATVNPGHNEIHFVLKE